MTFKQFLILLVIATALLWAGWIWTLFAIDPLATNWLGFVLFYLTLWMASTGALCLIGVAVRKWRQPDLLLYHIVARSFRQAIALSVFLTALLMLQGWRLLQWWSALAVFLMVAGFEAFLLRRNHKRRPSLPARDVSPDLPESSPTPLFVRKEVQGEEDSPSNTYEQ